MNQKEAANRIIRVCRMGWELGYLRATDGNVSARLDENRILITPSGRSKAWIEEADLIEADMQGNPLAGGKPSSEILLHLAAYRARPDVMACVHSHPPLATALSAAGWELSAGALPEVLVGLGEIPTATYATTGTPELAANVEPYFADHDAVMMDHHGSVTLGPNLEAAWARTEKVEASAQVILAAESLGGALPLSLDEQARLKALGGRGPAQDNPAPLSERIELKELPLTDAFLTEKRHEDKRGQAHLICDNKPIRRIALLTLKEGTGYRGGHYHRKKHEGFYVAAGKALVELLDVKSGEKLALELGVGQRLWMPPMIAHRIKALKNLTFVEFTDRPYDAEDDSVMDF